MRYQFCLVVWHDCLHVPVTINVFWMRTFLLMICTFCFLSFSISDKKAGVYGIWKGAYGMGSQVKQTWVYLEPNHFVKFYDSVVKSENKMTGKYSLLGDTAIVFTCTNKNGMQIKMRGNLNRTKSFVDGVWESNDDRYGSFYLQKQKVRKY